MIVAATAQAHNGRGPEPRKTVPRRKNPVDLRSLARSQTAMALRTLCGIAENSQNDSARVAAAVHILDRGWGKPATTHTGENGEGEIKVIIRHIVDGRDAPDTARVIEARPLRPIHNGNGEDEP